jgi:SAM-dependent methyltransferase
MVTTVRHISRRIKFEGSAQLWDAHYARGGLSGFGSYGDFAMMKAGVINEFVRKHGITSVIEFGCGDGNQLAMMEIPLYVGVDVSATAIELCNKRFANSATKSFFKYDTLQFNDQAGFLRCDLALSLDVMGHLIEREMWSKYIDNLIKAGKRFVIIHDIDRDGSTLKATHCRTRKFTRYISDKYRDVEYMERIDNPLKADGTAFHIFRRR